MSENSQDALKLNVVVITYNHALYIEDCNQRGKLNVTRSRFSRKIIRVLWLAIPQIFVWIFKALMPKVVIDKLYGHIA